jgi:hypothetical protein
MKVVDLQQYRSRKAILEIEQRVSHLVRVAPVGTAREIKLCFREWLRRQAR